MKRIFTIILGLIFIVVLSACSVKEDTAEMLSLGKEKTVGKDIQMEDITDFYYTEENINYGAYYQRYRFYVEEGKHMFFHETRERKDDYGPCTEEDTTKIGTLELTDDQWSQFYDFVNGGIVTAREDSADAGGTGPWLYLYWTNDKGVYQQFSFESYDTEARFEDFCISLVQGDHEETSDPGSPEDCITNDNLLFDYYEATVATVGGDESKEYCLYSYSDSQMVLARYDKTEDSEETMIFCTVPASVLDDCMDQVNRYQMQKWENGTGLDGKRYVVKFMDGNELKRVSSDDMPENGREAFLSIDDILGTAWSQYYQ